MDNKTPNFNRQKFILSFIKYAGGHLSKMDFQKLLFFYQKHTNNIYYDFIPYHYGCYSFQASSDLEILRNQNWISLNEKDINLLKTPDKNIDKSINNLSELIDFMNDNKNLRGDALIKIIYIHYPFYAMNSKISKSILNEFELQNIENEKQLYLSTLPLLFTIGYEGITFEGYINKLIQNNVRIICDVRNNPLSRKFGFSKSMLSSILPKIGINYIHIPELGIISSKRKNIENENDYKNLFDEYLKGLPKRKNFIEIVLGLYKKHIRLALTCFEKEPTHCHRYYLSHYIRNEYNIEVVDL
ncbi:MAG: DUF488 domain-containing protein [Brevinematales bacterium]|jgi:uncharacterized protein YwgA